MTDEKRNGLTWLRGMTETLVALLLLAATTGSVWSAMEVRAQRVLLSKIEERIDRMDARVERNTRRVYNLEGATKGVDRPGHSR